MRKLWELLRQKRNREVLGWLGGGLVVVAAGLWAAIVYFFPPQKPPSTPADVQANCGGVAIGGSVTGTSITGGTTAGSDCSTKPK